VTSRNSCPASPAGQSPHGDLDTILAQAVSKASPAQTRRALELIESRRITRTGFAGVWCVRSSDGRGYYATTADRCSCPAADPCYHCVAAALLDQAKAAGLLDDAEGAGLAGLVPGSVRARRSASAKRTTRAA
jgi:SWIM zinc finger